MDVSSLAGELIVGGSPPTCVGSPRYSRSPDAVFDQPQEDLMTSVSGETSTTGIPR